MLFKHQLTFTICNFDINYLKNIFNYFLEWTHLVVPEVWPSWPASQANYKQLKLEVSIYNYVPLGDFMESRTQQEGLSWGAGEGG